jgi:hypothetical protein
VNYLSDKYKRGYNYSLSKDGRKMSSNLSNIPSSQDAGFVDRIVTFEGPLHMSTEEKVFSSYVTKDIQAAVDAIVEHLSQQDIYLSNAVFYFKYNKKDDLYLLFATNIKCDRLLSSDIAMDRPVVLTIPKEMEIYPRVQISKQSKDVRIRPISAKPDNNYRSLVSQNRLKHF